MIQVATLKAKVDIKKNNKDLSKFKIFIFGKDLDEKTYCLRVDNFTPYFYVMIPDYCTKIAS